MPDDLHPHAVGRLDARAPARWKCALVVTSAARHDAVGEHLPGAVDVGEERLERAHPLVHARLDDAPTRRRR